MDNRGVSQRRISTGTRWTAIAPRRDPSAIGPGAAAAGNLSDRDCRTSGNRGPIVAFDLPSARKGGLVALPDFLVIGVPKAGTTALYAALVRHPQLFLPGVKEPKFFLSDGPPPLRRGGPGDRQTYGEHVWRRADYEALFDAAPRETKRGEA